MVTRRLFPIMETSQEEKEKLSKLNRTIDNLFEEGDTDEAEKLRVGSIKKTTLLYGPWLCNFRCPNYCYTKGTSDGVLTTSQVKEVIEQTKSMGAQLTYWPGEGELTLLKTFWDIMDHQSQQKLPAVLFTNGTIFHDDKVSKGVLDVDSDKLIERVSKQHPDLHLYLKYWSSNPEKAAEMVGVDTKDYPYEKVNGNHVPRTLAKLLEKVDRKRLGVEVMVSKENYDDVIKNILPTIEELKLYGYIEPVIFSGNARSKQIDLSLSPEQHQYLADTFASGGSYCEKRQSTELILKGSRLTPGIAIPPREEDCVLDEKGDVKDLYAIFHNDHFRRMRKFSEENGGCLCRKYWDVKKDEPNLVNINLPHRD